MLTLKCWGNRSKEHRQGAEFIFGLASVAERNLELHRNSIGFGAGDSGAGASNEARSKERGQRLSRALKSQKLWLTLTYLGLIVLMARTYA